MAGAWCLDGKPQAAQIVPAELRASGLPRLLRNPGGDFGPSPPPAIGSGVSEEGGKRLLLGWGEAGGFAGIGGTAIVEAVRTLLVITMDEVAEPVGAEANDGGCVFRRTPGGHQPQGVPAASSGRVRRSFVGREQFVRGQVWVQCKRTCHIWSIYHDLV